jgi:hypothetical protein
MHIFNNFYSDNEIYQCKSRQIIYEKIGNKIDSLLKTLLKKNNNKEEKKDNIKADNIKTDNTKQEDNIKQEGEDENSNQEKEVSDNNKELKEVLDNKNEDINGNELKSDNIIENILNIVNEFKVWVDQSIVINCQFLRGIYHFFRVL